jgi:autotransporter translocation and assembly factor TamB
VRGVRRLLRIIAFLGTVIVGVIAVLLIVSQTPWFRDWLRGYAVRQSKLYLNGDLTIGELRGNLFFGVQLSDVALDVSGERVVAVRDVKVDYSVVTLLSRGVVLDGIILVEPKLRLERDEDGWNIGRLFKQRPHQGGREGQRRSMSFRAVEIADGSLTIDDNGGSNGYHLPGQIEGLDVRATVDYAPEDYRIALQHASFRAVSPTLSLQQLTGGIALRDGNLHLERVEVRTDDSSVTVDGVLERYQQDPVFKLDAAASVSLPELGRVVPAASGYALHPSFEVKANGSADQLALDIHLRSEAGTVRGNVTADVKAPQLGIKGRLDLGGLNLAPILRDPARRSDIAGLAELDLKMETAPTKQSSVWSRIAGTYAFSGRHVATAGYAASDVRAKGTLQDGRITIDAQASAYQGSATATGYIEPSQSGGATAFDLRGRAEHVDLTRLPAITHAPRLQTDLSIAEYHVRGQGRQVAGTVTLHESVVEGATLAEGTEAAFDTGPGDVSYQAHGEVANLNLQRIGTSLGIEALAKPEYDSRVNGPFDVRGSGTRIETMTIDGSGTLTDTAIMGGRLPRMAFETRLADRALDVKVKGAFEHFDPARVTGDARFRGQVTGSADASVRIVDLTGPITPESVEASGRAEIAPSIVGALQIERATLQGSYEDRVGQIALLDMEGPDLAVNASGRLALDRTSSSSLTYLVDAKNLTELGRLAGQDGIGGSATLEGTLTGNAASMQTKGKLNGNNLSYGDNNALDLNSTFVADVPELTFGNARVEADSTARFVRVGGLELNEVEANTTYSDKHLEFTTNLKERSRELAATGRVIFHPDHQEIHLPQLAVRTEGLEWRTAPGTEPAIRYGGGRLTLEHVSMVSGEQMISLSGQLALGGEEPSSEGLKVDATNIDLAQLEKLLLQDRGLGGRLTASATVAGTVRQPRIDGHVEIVDGAFKSYTYQALKADVDYRASSLDLKATLQQSPTETMTAEGTIPMSLFRRSERGHVPPTPEDRVDLHVKSSDLQLGFIQGLTTLLTNVSGTLRADVRLTGSGQDPHLEGYIDIRDGAFGVPLGGVSYTGLDTRIELQPDLVRVQQFQLRDEHGEALSVSGQLAVHERQVGAVDVELSSNNFEVIDNQLGDLGLETSLRITGELRRPRVEGKVRIEAGRVEVDEVLQFFNDPYDVRARPGVVSAERLVEGSGSAEQATREALARAGGTVAVAAETKAEEEPEARVGPLDPVALDVRLIIPDNLVLRGRNLRPRGPTRAAIGDVNATVGGDLAIRKEPGEPVRLTGEIRTIRGMYEFQGRRFDLVRGGTLRFAGATRINPQLNVTARRLIPDTGVEARVHMRGSLEAPTLELSSTPPLEESDILSLIVFNRPVNELGSGERASLAASAGGIATGFIAAPLGESIGRALDLDLFEITTTTESGELGAGIIIGQQVGDRVFVKLRQEFGDRSLSEFLLDYQIADFFRIQASAAPETSGSANRIHEQRVERAGIDLIFFFSY